MLAYVFWHWPYPQIEKGSYEERLSDFHRSLATHRPGGFHYSAAFRIQGAGWLPAETAYEDWYLVDGSASLDVLNEAAIRAPNKESHDRAAQRAAGGIAGLYRLQRGEIDFEHAQFATWFSKPTGTAYDDFLDSLNALTSRPGVGLWMRQMTLGPTTEFCLQSREPIILPEGLSGLAVPITLVYPRSKA